MKRDEMYMNDISLSFFSCVFALTDFLTYIQRIFFKHYCIFNICGLNGWGKTGLPRHPIKQKTAQDDKEKWTAYKFVKNVYDHHSLKFHDTICSAINDLSLDINFDFSQSASFSQSTPQSSQRSNIKSLPGEDDSQLSFLGPQEITPSTSFIYTNEPAFKKPKNRQAAGQRRWNSENRRLKISRRFQVKFIEVIIRFN